jgi:hypothetical protein
MPGTKVASLTIPTDRAVLGYIAGLIDGEGCVSIVATTTGASRNVSHGLTLKIFNTNERVMLWLLATLGGRVRTHRRPSAKAEGELGVSQRDIYQWSANGSNAQAILMAAKDFFVIKKDQVELALEFAALRPSQRATGINGSRGFRLDSETVAKREDMKARLHVMKRAV